MGLQYFFDLLHKAKLENAEVWCASCKRIETARVDVEKKFHTFKCGCGVTIYYWPTEERPYYKKRFISAKEYKRDKARFDALIKGEKFEKTGIISRGKSDP